MKRKILSILLAFVMTLTLLPTSLMAAEPTYSDTAGHWAEDSIERWSDHGIIQGSNGEFDPNGQLTCAQLATILAKLLKLPAAKDAGFTDNKADAWYYDAINRCAAAGILNGNGDGTVTPEAPITRERAMVMLARALGIEPLRNPDLTKYTDAAQVSAYAQGYVAALIEAGIVGGVTADELAPQANINRASTVTILDRAIDTYADEAGATVKADGGLTLVVADDVTVTGDVDKLLVPADNVEVTVSGSKNIDDITVTGDNSKVILNNSTANDVTLDGKNAELETKSGSKVENVSVTEDAKGATVNAGSGTTVKNVENSAADTTVTGSGTVKNVASDTDITVETKNTNVENSGDEKITVTDAKGKETTVKPGTSTTVNKETTGSGGGYSHSHSYDTSKWVFDDVTHWRASTCGHNLKIDEATHTYDNNNVCTVCGQVKVDVAVAKIGSQNYKTLPEAVAAATDGATVTLLGDVTVQVVIPAEKKLTLDLNGKTITHSGTAIINNGTLIVKNGTVVSTGNCGIGVGDSSDTTIESGVTVNAQESAVITSKSTGASITINGGTFTSTDNAVIAGNGSARDGEPNTITINGGTFNGGITSAGYIACGIYAPWKDIITVNGGTFNITNGIGVVARAGQTTINGGTFICTGSAKGGVGDKHFDMDAAQALYFDASDPAYPAYNSETDYIKVTGGTFSSDPSAYVAEGYVVDEKEDGVYVVRAAKPGETAENPIWIETASDLEKIENSGVYTYYKVADNVTEIDCTDVSRLHLYGEFDGNSATLKNLRNSLFQYVGNGKETEETTVLKNFTAVMNTPNSLVFTIAGPSTKFEGVKVSGYMEGYWNMGAFVNYGSANYDDSGFDYTVEFAQCSCDATIISKQNNSAAVLVGHTYPGAGKAVIKLDSATNTGIDGATMRLNGGTNGYKYYGVGNATVYLGDATKEKEKLPTDNVTQLNVVTPTKNSDGIYTVTVQEGATAKAQLTAQLTAYTDGTEISNLRGITFTLGESTAVENGNVFDKVESVQIKNEMTASGRPAYTLENGVLTVYTNTTENYVTGKVSVTVSQYDAENKLCAIGSLVLAEKETTDAEQWTIK